MAQQAKSYDIPKFKEQYENFIGGEWVAPRSGEYIENISPVDGKVFTKVARSTAEDIELAVDAAHKAAPKWNNSSATERSNLLWKIADKIEENIRTLARAETWDNGKPIRETMAADLPLAVDHFRYFAGVIRAEEGGATELDANTVSMNIKEPLGVVAQIIPWNFPILMATWKMAPALAAGNCTIVKPAEQTPASIMVLMELIQDILPPGVLNIVNGFGPEAGKPLATNERIAKVAFTGETTTGRLIMQYASQNLIPVTLEFGGKSPNIFFESVMDADDEFFDKCLRRRGTFRAQSGRSLHLSVAYSGAGINRRQIYRTHRRTHKSDQNGTSARSRNDDRRTGEQGSIRENLELHPDRQRRRRGSFVRRRSAEKRRR